MLNILVKQEAWWVYSLRFFILGLETWFLTS
jgi:hypothetical protein